MSAEPKAGYGDRCAARFWPAGHEQACVLPPGHEGEHAMSWAALTEMARYVAPAEAPNHRLAFEAAATSDMSERFELLRWAGSLPDCLSLLRACREREYVGPAFALLERIVRGEGVAGERRVEPSRPDADLERYEDLRVRKYPPAPVPLGLGDEAPARFIESDPCTCTTSQSANRQVELGLRDPHCPVHR